MKAVCGYLKDGRIVVEQIDGTYLHCQSVMYAMYGRLNLKRIQFWAADRWVDSPYFMNQLKAY